MSKLSCLCHSLGETGSQSDAFEFLTVGVGVDVELLSEVLNLFLAERRPHSLRLRLLVDASLICNITFVTTWNVSWILVTFWVEDK